MGVDLGSPAKAEAVRRAAVTTACDGSGFRCCCLCQVSLLLLVSLVSYCYCVVKERQSTTAMLQHPRYQQVSTACIGRITLLLPCELASGWSASTALLLRSEPSAASQ